jgi:hypothetical protein
MRENEDFYGITTASSAQAGKEQPNKAKTSTSRDWQDLII